jgi:2-amino-4-hydroxy-6-hydroxymethyldihydropteridine diphosphokinase
MESIMMQKSISCLVLIGSNQEWSEFSSKDVLAQALRYFGGVELNVRLISRFYETPAFPIGSGPNYVNAALELNTTLDPDSVLRQFHMIEAEIGRIRDIRWGQRTIDIDLIACGDLVRPDMATHAHWVGLSLEKQMQHAPDELILPHPRMQDRAFVLGPLMDIAPDWRHPVSGLTVSEMFNALPQSAKDELQIL